MNPIAEGPVEKYNDWCEIFILLLRNIWLYLIKNKYNKYEINYI